MSEQTVRDRVLLLRPLLTVPREVLLRSLEGAPYRTDPSNLSPCCQRNRLRQEVLPLLRRENPRAAEHMAQSAALLALDEACLHAQAEALLAQTLIDRSPFFCLQRQPLAAAPPAVAARVLRLFYDHGAACAADRGACDSVTSDERSLSAADTLRLLALLRAPDGESLNLPRALRASVTARYMHLTRMTDGSAPVRVQPEQARNVPRPELLFPGVDSAMQAFNGEQASSPAASGPNGSDPTQTVDFAGLTFRFSPDDPASLPAPDGIRTVVLPPDALADAQLRLPRPGDSIRPFGAPGGKPLRRYLTDHKLDPPFRPWLPLLCAGGEVLWVVGVGASESTRRADGPAVRIDVLGALPWVEENP